VGVGEIDINDCSEYDDGTATMTIRNLPDRTKERLRVAVAKSGVSLEAYARQILQEAEGAEGAQALNLGDLARECFGTAGGVELELPARISQRESVVFPE
jgi:plasmid stability protein